MPNRQRGEAKNAIEYSKTRFEDELAIMAVSAEVNTHDTHIIFMDFLLESDTKLRDELVE